jgi:hypothetical protein
MIKQLKQSEIPELREKLIKKQKGICPLCKRDLDAPVLDHHHVRKIKGSGLCRGIICRGCNVLLGKIENNVIRCCLAHDGLSDWLANAAVYLRQKQLPYMHPTEAPKKKKLKKSSYNKLKKVAKKLPPYPKSEVLTKKLAEIYKLHNMEPEFCKVRPKKRRRQ